eukprot:CAMPEP_0204119920 /NCGR_PEP_ID=MMETSP0361-20130328/7381_1 /ASSEMBLY_ACC=CAM_ASM_000343 /TAXON_ID=268821 /ORGANISM="Scrippsiella Hangoei, Strain SHTV-5" /LENGTH=31 /DNA_ID= /DNA_START= /DNA_END= /DNA_ORIENTATION=
MPACCLEASLAGHPSGEGHRARRGGLLRLWV